MNSLFGEQITIDIVGKQVNKSENWMLNEYEERYKDYWSIGIGNYRVGLAQKESKVGGNDEINVMPLHLGAFVLSKSKRIMNKFVEAIGGFETNVVYYGDTESLNIENMQ